MGADFSNNDYHWFHQLHRFQGDAGRKLNRRIAAANLTLP